MSDYLKIATKKDAQITHIHNIHKVINCISCKELEILVQFQMYYFRKREYYLYIDI